MGLREWLSSALGSGRFLGGSRGLSGMEGKGFAFLAGGEPVGVNWSGSSAVLGEREAWSNSIVMACVHWAARNAAQAELVVQRRSGGDWETVAGHEAAVVLNSPQARLALGERGSLTGRKLIGAMVSSRMLSGNAYALKVRNGSGRVVGLDWLPHGCVEVVAMRDRPGVVDYYLVKGESGWSRVSVGDLVHDTDGVDPVAPCLGWPRLRSLGRQVATDNQIAAYSQALMASPVPSLMVTARGEGARLTQADADYVAGRLKEAASGSRAGSVIVPTFAADVTPVGYRPDDLAVEALSRLPEERITAVFGIPALVLGLGAGLSRATYANMREAREAATEEFLIPLWRDIAGTFTQQFLTDFEVGDGWRIWFDLRSVGTLQDDVALAHEVVREDFRAGLIERDEARARLGF